MRLMKKKITVKTIPEKIYNYVKMNYKLIFKFLTVTEMILLNNNLNGLTPDELLFTLKIKIGAIDDLLNNIWDLTDYEDLDPLNLEYFDLYQGE